MRPRIFLAGLEQRAAEAIASPSRIDRDGIEPRDLRALAKGQQAIGGERTVLLDHAHNDRFRTDVIAQGTARQAVAVECLVLERFERTDIGETRAPRRRCGLALFRHART